MKRITDSLSGAQILTDQVVCRLHEYNFVEDRWYLKDQATWPLSRARAGEWLFGWNQLDRFAAMSILTSPLRDFD